MEIPSGMSFCHFELSHFAASHHLVILNCCNLQLASQPLLQETMNGETISPSLWKKIQEQWQHDDFFGPRGYSNELDIASEGWGIGPGESDGFQDTEELFVAASQKFESVDESSEPEIDELFKVAL